MRKLGVRFFILLGLFFPTISSASMSCNIQANSSNFECLEYNGDTSGVTCEAAGAQTVASCSTSNLTGVCSLSNNSSKLYWYWQNHDNSTFASAMAQACSQSGGVWTAGVAGPPPSLPSSFSLTVTKSGTGSGTVTSTDGSINCGSTCSGSFTGSVFLTPTPDPGSTFIGWGGACSGTGECFVTLDAAKNVTATFNPVPFKVVTTGVTAGIITAPIATVTTTVSFNAADVSKPQAVFVTAWVPLGTLSKAQQARVASYTTLARPMGASAASTFVLVQLTQSGWQPVVNGLLIPYVSGVLGSQSAAVNILNNTSTANLLGSQFCVGYGTSAADMTAAGRMQLVATVANPNATKANTGSCNVALPISDARVFAFAEANYASLFTGTATSGQYQQYDYRYYAATQNYLGVDNIGVIYILGPVSNNVVTKVAPVDTFRSAITTWEGAQ